MVYIGAYVILRNYIGGGDMAYMRLGDLLIAAGNDHEAAA